MNFLNPIFFYFLLFLSIPIILSLFKFQKKKRVYFSSLLIFKQIYRKRRNILRLKNLILLIIRCLLISLIVILFAGLNFKSEQANITDILSYPDTVLLVDNSLSMEAKEVEGDLFSKAVFIIKKTINSKPNFKEISINQIYKPLPFITTANKNELLSMLEKLNIEENVINLSIALKKIESSLINKNVFYLTDNFKEFNDFENIDSVKYKSFNVIKITDDNLDNISIKNAAILNYFNSITLPLNLRVSIENLSRESKNNFLVSVYEYIKNKFELIETKYIDMKPQESIKMEIILNRTADNNLYMITIGKDKFEIDNNYYLVINKPTEYIVNVPESQLSDNLKKLFQNNFKFINSDLSFDNYNVLIIGASKISSKLLNELKIRIYAGLNVLIYTDKNFLINNFNNLYTGGAASEENILPGMIKEKISNMTLSSINFNHPIGYIYDDEKIKFQLPVSNGYKILKDYKSQSIVNFNEGLSLIVEKYYGKGKILLFGIDMESREIFSDYKYLPLIIQLIDYLGFEDNYNLSTVDFSLLTPVYRDKLGAGFYYNKNLKSFIQKNISREESNLTQNPNQLKNIRYYSSSDIFYESGEKIFFIKYKDGIIIFFIFILLIFERYFFIKNNRNFS